MDYLVRYHKAPAIGEKFVSPNQTEYEDIVLLKDGAFEMIAGQLEKKLGGQLVIGVDGVESLFDLGNEINMTINYQGVPTPYIEISHEKADVLESVRARLGIERRWGV